MKTFKDLYKFPFRDSFIDEEHNWRSQRIFDSENNFLFQFIDVKQDKQQLILDIINGENKELSNKKLSFRHEDGYIFASDGQKETKIIIIRGWGNLTGIGAHNLKPEVAADIQDTLAEYIVEQLNKSII